MLRFALLGCTTATLMLTACSDGTTGGGPRSRLSMVVAGDGRIDLGGGLDCRSSCFFDYPPGTVVTLTAIASPGWQFKEWGQDCAGQGTACTLTLQAPKNVVVTFELSPDSGVLPDGGATSDAGAPADGGQSIVDGGLEFDAGTADGGPAPIEITILSPLPDATVAGAQATIEALVRSRVDPLDPSELTAQVTSRDPVLLVPVTGVADTYRTVISLSGLASGRYDLQVNARTLNGVEGAASQKVVVNTGPVLTLLRPVPGEPVRDSLVYDFTVRIAPELTGINVATVTATVGTCNIPLGTPTVVDGIQRYSGNRDLTQCSPTLAEGVQPVRVEAADSSGVSSVRFGGVRVDRTGPQIGIVSPQPAEIVGGVIEIEANIIDDPSGVDSSGVKATISHGGESFTVDLFNNTPDSFVGTFDTRRLPNSTVIQFPAIEIVARDRLGNDSTTGGIQFALDNVAPLGDLDPPDVVIRRPRPGMEDMCSHPFDPLGGDVPNDMAKVNQLFDIRAEIGDRGNVGGGGDRVYHSGIREITLHVLADTSRPLVVDSTGNGICDAVNPEVVSAVGSLPGPGQALALRMIQVPLQGNPDFSGDYSVPSGCVAGMQTAPPPSICATTPMTYVLRDFIRESSLIWTLPPVAEDPVQCAGLQFDTLANNIPEGWICLAVAMVDNVGNRSVSKPLRLCVERGSGTCDAPPAAPDCTGTLNVSTGIVTSDACQPETITAGTRVIREIQ